MRSPRSLLLGTVGILVAALAASERSGYAQPPAFGDMAGSAEPAGLAVAVVPFANVSARPEDDWLGIGIAETVVAGVDRLGLLTVVDRRSLFGGVADGGVAGGALDDETWARDRARAAGVSWLVVGGFQRLGDQVRIIARLTDVETGALREVAKVDGHADDLFLLQDRIVAEVAGGLARLVRPGASALEVRAAVARETGGRRGTASPPGARAGDESGPSSLAARSRRSLAANRATPAAGALGPAPAGDAGVLTGRVTVRPRRTTTPPTVDGLLDDAVWSNAARITEFVQREPQDGASATEDTDVYLAYDDSNLYLAFHARYEDPGIMRANRVDRDRAGFGDDTISVYFDTFLDQQRAYVFSVNGYGVDRKSVV